MSYAEKQQQIVDARKRIYNLLQVVRKLREIVMFETFIIIMLSGFAAYLTIKYGT